MATTATSAEHDIRTSTTVRRSLAALTVLLATFGVASTGGAAPDTQAPLAPCTQPYPPMWQELMPGPESWPQWPPYPHDPPFVSGDVGTAGGPAVVAEHPDLAGLVLDTDGDGEADDVSEENGSDATDLVVRIDRSDGTIRLNVDLVEFDRANRAVRPVGDLDGDGRSEVLVGSRILAGTITPGEHDLGEVGIALPSGAVVAAGDQDGDGTADLFVGTATDPSGRTHLVEGPAAMAPGPGGSLEDLGSPSFPGEPVSAIDLGSGPPAVGVVSPSVLTVVQAGEAVHYEVMRGLGDSDLYVLAFEGRRYLTLYSSVSAAGAFRAAYSFWDLADPCRELPRTGPDPTVPPTTEVGCLCAPPLPGRPAPAVPVRATASYAG